MTRSFFSALPYAALLAVGAACGEEEPPQTLLLPEPVPVAWEAPYDGEDDGLGALVPVDVMVYDSATGEPVTEVELVVWMSEEGAAWPVAAEELVVVEPDQCVQCELLWDAERDEFLQPFPMSDELTLSTDDDGLARLYLYVDSFPEGADGRAFGDLVVLVSMGSTEESFLLLPR
ncbi:MAG: hypothetical protein KTR31_15650 [Myxococcales bacterium]|nr:hypothetical protein [Myxococcales bacterium]